MDEQEQQNINQVEPTPLSPPPSHKKLVIGIVVVFVLVVAGVAGAYFLFQPKAQLVERQLLEKEISDEGAAPSSLSPTNIVSERNTYPEDVITSEQSPPIVLSRQVSQEEIVNWKLFRNKTLGLEIFYPTAWEIEYCTPSIDGAECSIAKADETENIEDAFVLSVVLRDPETNNEKSLSITLYSRDDFSSSRTYSGNLDDITERYRLTNWERTILSSQEVIIAGEKGILLETQGREGGISSNVYIPHEARVYSLSFPTNEEGFPLSDEIITMLSTLVFISDRVEDTTRHWPVYRNFKYNFELRYPPGWRAIGSGFNENISLGIVSSGLFSENVKLAVYQNPPSGVIKKLSLEEFLSSQIHLTKSELAVLTPVNNEEVSGLAIIPPQRSYEIWQGTFGVFWEEENVVISLTTTQADIADLFNLMASSTRFRFQSLGSKDVDTWKEWPPQIVYSASTGEPVNTQYAYSLKLPKEWGKSGLQPGVYDKSLVGFPGYFKDPKGAELSFHPAQIIILVEDNPKGLDAFKWYIENAMARGEATLDTIGQCDEQYSKVSCYLFSPQITFQEKEGLIVFLKNRNEWSRTIYLTSNDKIYSFKIWSPYVNADGSRIKELMQFIEQIADTLALP